MTVDQTKTLIKRMTWDSGKKYLKKLKVTGDDPSDQSPF